MSKKQKGYVSDIDKKMADFDNKHPLSAAQQAEVKKYQEITSKRDHARLDDITGNDEQQLWEGF